MTIVIHNMQAKCIYMCQMMKYQEQQCRGHRDILHDEVYVCLNNVNNKLNM
jgi:hypothetical protein